VKRLFAVAVFEFAFDHITFTPQWLARSRTATRLQVIGERQRILVHQLPERAQIDIPLTEQLIVELYSK
jgi:ribosomal protein S4